MANDIDKTSPHYKGDFGSIYEVNKKFPTGGVAGDFVVIEGWAHYWNADRATWCVNAERDSYWDELITNIIEKFKLVRGATYMGVASLDTVPAKVVGAKMYYFATVAGTYKNFGDLVVPQGINVLYSENGSSWVNTTLLEVAQELGVSTKKVVSQKALNDALNLKANQSSVNEALAKKADKETVKTELAKKFDKESVVQESGEAEDKVMSQKAVSDKLSDLSRFANDGEFLDFEEFTKDKLQKIGAVIQGKYINNGIWTDSTDALCVLIPATNIAKVTFYAKSNSCEYAFLQNNTQTPTFCNNTTINSLKARYVVSVEIPADCAFIYVCAYRGGTSLLSGITLFSKNAILNTKSPIVPTGVLDLAKFQNINYGGDAPFLYPDKTRAQIFIPCRNIEYLKITVDNLYRVALLGYRETMNNIFSIVPTTVSFTYTDGMNVGVPIQNVTKICFIPENVGTLRLWIRKDDDSDLSLDDLNSHIRIEFISSIDNNLDKAKVAACSTLINTVVYVDTKEKKIFFPSTFAILYGRQQTKSYAFTSVTVVDYDISGIGDYCKIVFNPQNDTKLYVVDRNKPLEADEYYICGIFKPTGFLTLPAYQYCVDGKQYNSYIRRQSDTIMYYDGDKISLPIKKRNSLALTRIGQSAISNECYYNNELYYAQGMDTFKNYLFRLYYSASNKSLCKVYDIANILEPTLVDSFPLGYQGDYIHCNACQFGKEIDSETGFPLLYVRNGESGKCTVEKISLHSSELLQVINIDTSNIFTEQSESNIIIGDDGYLWLFGANNSKMFFAKFNVPNKSNGNVSLGKDNVVDSWKFEFQDSFTNKTWQGGKIYREHLYFLFGNNSISNRLYIFNTSTHELEKLLPLSAIQEECEDISFLEDSMLIGIDDTYNGIYKLNEL